MQKNVIYKLYYLYMVDVDFNFTKRKLLFWMFITQKSQNVNFKKHIIINISKQKLKLTFICFFKLAEELLFAWIIFLLTQNWHLNAKFFSSLSLDSSTKIFEYAGQGALQFISFLSFMVSSVIVPNCVVPNFRQNNYNKL